MRYKVLSRFFSVASSEISYQLISKAQLNPPYYQQPSLIKYQYCSLLVNLKRGLTLMVYGYQDWLIILKIASRQEQLRRSVNACYYCLLEPQLLKQNGYQTRQTLLLYVIVSFFGPDRAQRSIAFPVLIVTNRNIALIYSVTICKQKPKDCARSGSFQHKLQHR